MKTVILAGGLGSRLGQLTSEIPKPMIKVGNMPIIWHLINIYAYHGQNDFIIALGYKSKIIRDFFNKKKINKTLDDHLTSKANNSSKLWPLLMFLQWYKYNY